MADKYIGLDGTGNKAEVEGTVTSTGVAEAGDIVALDATGKIDTSILPTGIGADVKILEASESLSAGDLVNVWNDTTAKVRKADATTTGKEADGFVKDAYTSGQNATVYFEGVNDGLAGLTLGSKYYLGTTAGGITTTVPTTTGNVRQYVGKALSATELSFEASDAIIRA